MVFVDDGIKELGKLLRGESDTVTPDYLSFAGSDNTYNGTESSINNEFIRKSVTWEQTGIQSKYLVQLLSTEANGSYIDTVALTSGSDVSTGSLFTINSSFIGTKNSSFNVQIEGEIIIRRST